MPSVLLTTDRHDLTGPAQGRAGGCAGLAAALVAEGNRVTLLHTRPEVIDQRRFGMLVDDFAAAGVELKRLPQPDYPVRHAGMPARRAHALLEWLKRRRRDVLLAEGGVAYYALQARRLGDFAGTAMIVRLSRPTAWSLAHALHAEGDIADLLEADALERRSAALADRVIVPDADTMAGLAACGWTVKPREVTVLEPFPVVPAAAATPGLLFLAETEAGVLLAAATLALLGKPANAAVIVPDALVERARAAVACPVAGIATVGGPADWPAGTVVAVADETEAVPETACLAAMAGLAVVLPEGLRLAGATQAARHPAAFAEALRSPTPPPPADPEPSRRRWLELSCQPPRPAVAATPTRPLVSVCLVHHRRPALLRQAVESVLAQDYSALDVVLADDGSATPEAEACLDALAPVFQARGWRILRLPNRYLGAARNAAAREARGDRLLFLDDDNQLKPHAVSRFVEAAQRLEADVVTCFTDDYTGDAPAGLPLGRYLPVGAAPALGLFRNCFGDANALVSRRCLEAVGGFSEDRGVGHEDWELFARAVLGGFRLEVVPEALVWYRVAADGGSMLGRTSVTANQRRALRPYLGHVPAELLPLLAAVKAQRLRGPA